MIKKILIISNQFYPAVGGIETITEGLADTFFSNGYDVHVITKTAAIGIKKFPYSVIRKPTCSIILRELRWADIILENNPCLRLSWLNIVVKKPIVIGLQTWLKSSNEKANLVFIIKEWWLKRASRVIACSNAIKNEIFKEAIVVENFYNENIFRKIENPSRKRDFVFLGRLVSDKGAGLAIQAFQKILHSYPESNLTIIGEGPEMQPLQQIVTRQHLDNRIIFKGNMQGEVLVRCLNEHRFLLVPSLWREPFGIVALEGLACGCIPIVSDGGGLPDAVGNAGLVFKRGDETDLLNKMVEVKRDQLLQAKLLNAVESHLEKHTLEYIANSYLSVMEEVK